MTLGTNRSPRLRLRLAAGAEKMIRAGHPWLFAESVRQQNRPGDLGEFAFIYDRHDRFLAAGLFDPDSPLRVRVLHLGNPKLIDAAWWRGRLEQALERRAGLFDAQTTGYRLIHGESDGWPGLVLDRYGGTVVLKLYTGAWLPHLTELLPLLVEGLEPERLVLRLSRNIQTLAGERFGRTDGQVLAGRAPSASVTFLETGLRFEADVLRGQKTGFFLDQRENRRRVESLARDRDVLNLFSFAGAFSVYAARGGAHSTTDLDISAHALSAARRHFALNAAIPAVAACRHDFVQADAFEWLLLKPQRRFNLLILDPPALARRKEERPSALHAYEKLVSSAVRHLAPGGLLVASSCSAHVTADEFFQVVRRALLKATRSFEELAVTRQPPDHPAAFKEAEYLKTIYLRINIVGHSRKA